MTSYRLQLGEMLNRSDQFPSSESLLRIQTRFQSCSCFCRNCFQEMHTWEVASLIGAQDLLVLISWPRFKIFKELGWLLGASLLSLTCFKMMLALFQFQTLFQAIYFCFHLEHLVVRRLSFQGHMQSAGLVFRDNLLCVSFQFPWLLSVCHLLC